MRKIYLFLVMMVFSLALTGCATMKTNSSSAQIGSQHTYGKYVYSPTLVTPSLDEAMSDNDKKTLVQLISTANKHQVVTWKGDGRVDAFEFTSLNIFVDDHGRVCRTYRVRALVDGDETITPDMTACRRLNGNWQVIQ